MVKDHRDKLLIEACELLEECSKSLGCDVTQSFSHDLAEWWGEYTAERARRLQRIKTSNRKITVTVIRKERQ